MHIERHNGIAFCTDWMGWWHQYAIALNFPCVFIPHRYIFLSSGSFDLHWFALIESLGEKHVAQLQSAYCKETLQVGVCSVCFYLPRWCSRNEMKNWMLALLSWLMSQRNRESEMAEWRQSLCNISWTTSITIATYSAHKFPLCSVKVTRESAPSLMQRAGNSPTLGCSAAAAATVSISICSHIPSS